MEKQKLLVVDDDRSICEQLKWALCEYDVQVASNREEALKLLKEHEPAVVTLDLGLPPCPQGVTEGLALLDEIIYICDLTKVILITGQVGRDLAIQAIGSGAYDFYEKPIQIDELKLIIARAFYLHRIESDYRRIHIGQQRVASQGIISTSALMERTMHMVEKVAPTQVTTLLYGESGTGKEILARAIHRLSDRAKGPFVAINCAAIPETLLESELFGHERGAFTGADRQTVGRIERANGGTLFLDEIGDLPLTLQPKLLRFLQERIVERVGGHQEIAVDVRVICATHRNLRSLIEKSSFREDLYYRISEVVVEIPSLRERGNDIVLLARAFLFKFAREMKRPIKGFLREALEALESYHWPGNVRELENVVKRSVIMGDGLWIKKLDLALPSPNCESSHFSLKEVRDHAERDSILRALQHVNGNVSRAAELLGITRPTLYHLMEKLNIREKNISPNESVKV